MANILVLDDEEAIGPMLREYLVQLGHSVKLASTAVEALGFLETERFDLAIVDVMMPGWISGIEVCRGIKSYPRTAGMQVVVISGVPENQVAALEAGASAFVLKPFNLSEIGRLVSELVRSEPWPGPPPELLLSAD